MTLEEVKTHILNNTLVSLSVKEQKKSLQMTSAVSKKTALHEAARSQTLKNIPDQLITPKLLNKKDKDDRTPIHLAACYGCLNQIPPSLLTAESLSQKTQRGNTVYHIAATTGNLKQIPPPLLKADQLLKRNHLTQTPLLLASQRGHLESLKSRILADEVLKLSKKLIEDKTTPQNLLAWIKKEEARARIQKSLEQQAHIDL